MAKLETEITVSVRDLPEVQQTLTECRELRDAAQEYMRTCPAAPDTTPEFYAAHERLRTALAALTPASGVAAAPAPAGMVRVGFICKDDLATLLRIGAATVYEERQEFLLLHEQEQFEVFVRAGADGVTAAPAPDGRQAFEREFPEAWAYWNDAGDYLRPYDLMWKAFKAGRAVGVKGGA